MSSNDHGNMLYTTNAYVAALNKTSGFDPLKLLRRTVSQKTGEEVLKLDLRSKKLWFRLAYPKGRVRLTPLRITEKMAIYEAQVFLNLNDAEPVSSFTSSFLKAEAPKGQYIQAAQDEAVDRALEDAGFGIQFSDVSTPEEERLFGSEYPVSQLKGKVPTVKDASSAAPAAVKQPPAVKQESQQKPDPVAEKTAPAVVAQEQPKHTEPVQPKEKPAKKEPATQIGANHALEILRSGSASKEPDAAPVVTESAVSDVPVATYTQDMPVEEIIKRMSLEQAKAVVVDSGTCRGKTIEEVAARRSASLKFYLSPGYTSNNNIIRAAARIMLDSMNLQKAG